jgi:thiamine-phosphate pyrophosphorylase
MLTTEALRLIAITGDLSDGVDVLVERATLAVRGGATMLQVRLKDAAPRSIVQVTRRLIAAVDVPVIVNDRADIALAAGAAGVHLGADDLPPAMVRRLAPSFIIGASVGSDTEVALAQGADYVGIGPAFSTSTKLDAGSALGPAEVARLARLCSPLPAVAVGGITELRAAELSAEHDVAGIAVVRAIFGADDPEGAARALRAAIGR